MPLYDFLNANTNESEEHFMRYDDREQFLVDNPHLSPLISKMSIGDPIMLKVTRPPGWMGELINKAKTAHPHGNLQ